MTDRGQATLLSLAVAVLLVTMATGVALAVAAGSFDAAEREPADRRLAVDAADRLLAPSGDVARAPGALDATALATLQPNSLERLVPGDPGGVGISLDGERLTAVGDPRGGTTVRRLVVLETPTRRVRTLTVGGPAATVTLAAPTRRLRVNLSEAPGVTALELDGRVVRRSPGGFDEPVELRPDPTTRPRLTFTGAPGARGNVTLTSWPWETRYGTLAVTVDG